MFMAVCLLCLLMTYYVTIRQSSHNLMSSGDFSNVNFSTYISKLYIPVFQAMYFICLTEF